MSESDESCESDEGGRSFLIEQRDQIEVYAGARGHVCIKQSSPLGEEDALIIVHPEDIVRLINYLQRARQEAIEIREAIENEGRQDP